MPQPISGVIGDKICELYAARLSRIKIAKVLKIDRHSVGLTLTARNIPRRSYLNGMTFAEWSKWYEKTPKGFLMRAHRNMRSRVKGIQKKCIHLYLGLPVLPLDEFYDWALDNYEFWRLYKHWVASGYNRKLTPSVNRIDSTKGYLIENMEWVTHSVNSSLGATSPRRMKYYKRNFQEVVNHVNA